MIHMNKALAFSLALLFCASSNAMQKEKKQHNENREPEKAFVEAPKTDSRLIDLVTCCEEELERETALENITNVIDIQERRQRIVRMNMTADEYLALAEKSLLSEQRDTVLAWLCFKKVAFQSANKPAQAVAWSWLGVMSHFGLGVHVDARVAYAYYKKAAEQNESTTAKLRGSVGLGKMYYDGSLPVHALGVLDYLKNAAAQEIEKIVQAKACIQLADIYLYRLNRPAEALPYLTKAAQQDDDLWSQAYAWQRLGQMYEEGRGLELNSERAVSYFKMAANQQHNQHVRCKSLAKLGELYFVHEQYRDAYDCFELLKDLNETYFQALAHYYLGYLYFVGLGMPADHVRGYYYLKLAQAQTANAWARSAAAVLLARHYNER